MTESEHDRELNELAEEFTRKLRRGESPRIDDYLERSPHLARDIEELFPTLAQLEHAGDHSAEEPSLLTAEGLDEGSLFGDYRIVRELGRGGMGIVYEAEQSSLGRRVALKILPDQSLRSKNQLERFRSETRVVARLNHPNIVPLLEVGEWNGIHYFAMQLISGESLSALVERKKHSGATPSADDYLHCPRYVQEAAEGLAYAHSQGILHRDIKPANLLLDTNDTVWITDFGLAKSDEDDDLTLTGDVLGTLRYLAPERFSGWADARTDVYSLGVTLYELATLQPAFAASTRAQLVRTILNDQPAPPRRIAPDIPRDLETIIVVAMEKEPERRYTSAAAMAEDLRRFRESRPIKAKRSSSTERLALWARRNPTVALLASSIILMLVAVAVIATVTAAHLRQVANEKQELADNLSSEQATTLSNLRTARLEEARARRLSGESGQRHAAIRALVQANRIRPGPDVRDELIAALARIDLQESDGLKFARTHPAFAFSPSFDRYAAFENDRVVLRRTTDRRTLRVFKTPVSHAWRIRFSPDESVLVGVFGDELRAWKIDTGEEVVSLTSGATLASLDFDLSSEHLAVGSRDSVRILSLSSGEIVRSIPFAAIVRTVRFHPEDSRLAIALQNVSVLEIRDWKNQRVAETVKLDAPAFGLAWYPQGDALFAGCDDGRIIELETENWKIKRSLDAHHNSVTQLDLSPGGDLLVSHGYDARVVLWEPRLGQQLLEQKGYATEFSRDGESLGLRRGDTVQVFDVLKPTVFRGLHGSHLARSSHLAFHPKGTLLASVSRDEGLQIWDLENRQPIARARIRGMSACRFHPSGQQLLTSSNAGLHSWPIVLEGGQLKIGPPQPLNASKSFGLIEMTRDGKTLVAVHKDTHFHSIDLSSATETANRDTEVSSALGGLKFIDISPDRRWIAGGAWKGQGVSVWRSDQLSSTPIRLETKASTVVRFDPLGRWLATGDTNGFALWDLSTWTVIRQLGKRQTELDSPGSMAFSPDGKILAMARELSSIHLVNPETGTLVASLEAPFERQIQWLEFSHDGSQLAAATPGRSLQVWDLRAVLDELTALEIEIDLTLSERDRRTPSKRVSANIQLGELTPPPITKDLPSLIRDWANHVFDERPR